MIELIEKYFPKLSERQREQYAALGTLYPEWNAKINVIFWQSSHKIADRC